jgi:AraC-like DNA-binding protein
MTAASNNSTANDTLLSGVIPATYVHLLYDYLAAKNIDAEKLLGPQPTVDKGLGRFPVVEWKQHLKSASELLNDPLLGLHLGQTISPKHFGVLGYVLLSCGTLGAALLRLQQYHQLIYDVNPMEIEADANQVTLLWGLEMGRPGALVDETAISSLLQSCRDITDSPNYAPQSVAFVNPAPSDPSAYENWFGCPVEFDQSTTRITLKLSDLETPLRTADPALIEILEQQADALLADLQASEDRPLSAEIRRLIVQQIRNSEPSADSVAAALHITSRTLHRKLSAESTSFRQVLQQTRHQLAKQYLQDPRLQLSEIALLLAYSEQSAFNRAFKSWQQQTPAQYRRQL